MNHTSPVYGTEQESVHDHPMGGESLRHMDLPRLTNEVMMMVLVESAPTRMRGADVLGARQ